MPSSLTIIDIIRSFGTVIHRNEKTFFAKPMRSLLFVTLLVLQASFGIAQDRILLGGVLKNHLTGEAIPNVHVMNLTDSLATISSLEGAFKIPVHLGDSLVFTSIGYHSKALIVTAKEFGADFIEVRMVQREYQLGEVEVNPFGSKEQFRQKFMELEVDDGTIEIVGIQGPSKDRRTIPITEDADEIKKAKHLFKSPASFLYGNFSKDAKARQELHRLEAEKEKHRYNYSKFNEDVVHRITSYEGTKLLEFMAYCNFSEDQIFRYSDYELTVAIMNKQKSYERISQDSATD
ncbi:MAG: hypothetical protein KBF73_00565 [Flavobacteriales bacterium]|nr:hypothetical protein [Flavobacteriales bacterium]